jgi:hypothetical protein
MGGACPCTAHDLIKLFVETDIQATLDAWDQPPYYLATDGITLGLGAAMYVVIGTSFGIDYSQDASLTSYLPNSASAMPYQKFTTNITATASSEMLSFHGYDATSAILLDDVSVTLVIPPQPFLSLHLVETNSLVFTWTSQAPTIFRQTRRWTRPIGWP